MKYVLRPQDVKNLIHSTVTTNLKKRRYRNVKLDLWNHLSYKSPLNGKRIRVHPLIEKKMIENREAKKNFFKPHEIDELLHLIMHSVFDKDGEFKEKYKDKCNDIWSNMNKNNPHWNLILNKGFFQASELIESSIESKNYDQLLNNLKKYSDY